ncbi:MAG: flagellar export protein FliJ [Thiobacillus sp.]|nr:flagellar export protein FliJ [Thiobacillus sp.]
MARAFSLQILLEHSIHRMEAAERLLRMLGRKEEAARQRLEEIQGYKQEYQQRMTGAGQQGLEIHRLREYYAFLLKVDQAISHQEGEVDKARANWAAAHEKWLEQRRQVKAYEVLAQRHHQEARRQEEKRDQRATDEAAAHKYHPLGGRNLT